MYDELIKRLRNDAKAFTGFVNEDLLKAADAIEELLAEREESYADSWKMAFEIERDAHRWIPVTERLPEENGHYLVHAVGNGYYSTYIALWNGRFRANFEMPITHWMPLPEPPKDGEA